MSIDQERLAEMVDRGGSNGAVSQTPPPQLSQASGPKLPGRREVWLELPAPYDGHKFKMWVNFPGSVGEDLNGASDDLMYAAIGQVVVEHNGWRDDLGTLPPPSEPAFWRRIPQELAVTIISLVRLETQKLPNSVTRSRQR